MNNIVSIIVPVYKVEKYLNKCLSRIVNQTYANLQIILVDDGSPDNCPKICDQWAAKDKRIEVVHKKNGGLSDARNAGLKVAKGEYVVFVDSDDYISINMIENMLTAMLNNYADMVICQFLSVTPDGITSRHKPIYGTQILSSEQCLRLLMKDAQITNHVWRKMYKRILLPDNLFPVGKNYEDVYVMADLVMACNKIVSLDEAYYYYLKNNSGILQTVNKKNTRDFYDAFKHSFNSIITKHPEMKKEVSAARKKIFNRAIRLYFKSIHGVYVLIHPFGILSRHVKRIAHKLSQTNRMIKKIKAEPSPRFFIFGTPGYGNLGDRALTIGEDNFIEKYFPDHVAVHVPLGVLNKLFLWKVKSIISEKDKIAFQAGGNFGSLYAGIHNSQEKAIYALRKYPIVVFPQTVFYSNDTMGQKMLEKTKKVYQSCSDLTITLREKVSYEFVKKAFPEIKALLIPDMVLNIPEFSSDKKRNGALICLRNDAEATLSNDEYCMILHIIRNRFNSLTETDTHVYYALTDEEAKIQLNNLWTKMASSELVVTDRLHGMFFSALTHTPCICVMSKSPKIKGCYEWIKNLDYIELVEDLDNLDAAINKVISVKNPFYNVSDVREMYQELARSFSD